MSSFALVVLGLSPAGLYAIREAANVGVAIYGFSDRLEAGAASRHLTNRGEATVVSLDETPGCLMELAKAFERVGVIPTTDRHVELLMRMAGRFPKNIEIADGYRTGVAETCLDKVAINKAAQKAGISVPWGHDLADGWPDPAQLEFPLIVKPKSIHRQRHWLKGKKLFVCDVPQALEQVRQQPEFDAADWSLQQLVDGPESNIRVSACFCGKDNTFAPVFTAAKLRQFPADFGSASLLVSTPDDEVAGASRRLLRQMGFEGIAGVEFKRSASDGILFLVEMNPRPSLWFSAATTKGYFLVLAQMDEWFGTDFARNRKIDEREVTWRYAIKDRSVSWQRWLRPGRFVLPAPNINIPAGSKRCWAVYDSNDPLPAFLEVGHYLGKFGSFLR